jgi:CubicO group peptidase (beta-lactamase class C family)
MSLIRLPAVGLFCVATLLAQLSPGTGSAIDQAVAKVMAETGAPSASLAIVKDSRLVYVRAYGHARLQPPTPARPEMRYKIASNSKQFLAALVVRLATENKLSLDDPVSKYFPELTRASEVTIRQLLAHTSGYQDCAPLDYLPPALLRPITPQGILDIWAKKPLDFDPGTKWQYSNTNYTIAGLIAEKVTGKGVIELLRARFFEPLGLTTAMDVDYQTWSEADPTGYTRYALGPARAAPIEGKGWMFAGWELAMTASDLARWDLSLLDATLLKPAEIRTLTTEIQLKNGTGTGYGLGFYVSGRGGHLKWSHGGEASGFVSSNFILPEQKIAAAILTNQDDGTASRISAQIEKLLTQADDPGAAEALERARRLFAGLQQGAIDRTLLTSDANAYFTSDVMADFAASLKPLGVPTSFSQTAMTLRGGMVHRTFQVKTTSKTLSLNTFLTPDGKFAQFLISPAQN